MQPKNMDKTLDVAKDGIVDFGANVEGRGNVLAQKDSTLRFKEGFMSSFKRPEEDEEEEEHL